MCVVVDEFYEAVDSLQLQGNVASDVNVVNETADVEAASVTHNSVTQVDVADLVNSSNDTRCYLSSDLSADHGQCMSKYSMSGDEDGATSNSISKPMDSALTDDNVESRPQDTADMQAGDSDTQSENKEVVVGDNVSGVDEAVHIDSLQPVGSQLPVLVAEEPSMADSNDDFAEFVEASTSLNTDSVGELCVNTLPVTSVETQQLETGTDAEHQPDVAGDVNNKEEKQHIDLSSGVSPVQSGDEFAGNSPLPPSSADDNMQSQQFYTTDNNVQASNSTTQLHSIQIVDGDRVSGVECAANGGSILIDVVSSADNTQSQQHDCVDDMPVDSSVIQLESKEAVISDGVSGIDEAVDGDFLQPSSSQLASDVNQFQQLDNPSSESSQQTYCSSLPLLVAEEPSTADSNDDFAEFVEASTSLNTDSAEELCVSTLPVTSVETGTDVEHQPDEDGYADDKEEEQFVDSSSDIFPQQPVEGKYWQFVII